MQVFEKFKAEIMVIKKTGLLLFLFYLHLLLFGQNEKGYVGVSVGPSFPLRDFADNNINNINAGFAKTGVNINAFVVFKPLEKLGIVTQIRVQNNPVNIGQLNRQLRAQYTDKGANGWRVDGFMLGILGSFFLPDINITFGPKAIIGIVDTSTPSFYSNYSKVSSLSVFSIAALIGAGLRYGINDKTSFLINTDFLYTKCYSQNISTYNLEFGIAFKIK